MDAGTAFIGFDYATSEQERSIRAELAAFASDLRSRGIFVVGTVTTEFAGHAEL